MRFVFSSALDSALFLAVLIASTFSFCAMQMTRAREGGLLVALFADRVLS